MKTRIGQFRREPLAFAESEHNLARYARALAHPARLAILKKLVDCGACICGDIVDILPFAQSTVSQHLQELVEAGMIKRTSNGPRSCYSINWDALEAVDQLFSTFLGELRSAS